MVPSNKSAPHLFMITIYKNIEYSIGGYGLDDDNDKIDDLCQSQKIARIGQTLVQA
jgi:hypothetical protein